MKKGLKFLLLADSLMTFGIAMIGPIYAIFVQEIGGDLLDASWAYFFFMMSSGIAIFIIGKFEDSIKTKEYFITAGYALSAIGSFSYLLVYNQFTLIIVQVILGIAEAIQLPAYDATYAHYIDKNKEASEWGDWEALTYITTALAAIAGGYLAKSFGFSALFIAMGILGTLGAFISLNMFKKKRYLNSHK